MRGRGTVDLLLVPGPVSLKQAAAVEPFLAGPEGGAVKQYLSTVVERGNLFARPRYLKDALVDLCFGAVLVSRFARCRAAAAGREAVTDEDVREGISVCELVLLHHVVLSEEGKTMQNLRTLMLSDRHKLRELLASEAPAADL
jgi:lysine-N-methylase